MFKIGIIVNPFSGKDLRRISSQASNVGNNEKAIKVVRMINSMKVFGAEKIYLMPDNFLLNASIVSTVRREDKLDTAVELLDFEPTDRPGDTIRAVKLMKNLEISCLIVLGGDGTCRLVAKTEIDVPIIPVSTGTNNVYTQFWEGTTVGIAASYVAINGIDECSRKSKRIEVYINGVLRDIALVDAVVTDVPYVGSKVVTEPENIKEVIVSMCSPASVGFSAIIGNIAYCSENDDFGYRLRVSEEGKTILAPICPGKLSEITYEDHERMELGSEHICLPNYDGTVALDGERTVTFRKDDKLSFVITRKGPCKVDVTKTLCEAVEKGFFIVTGHDYGQIQTVNTEFPE